MSDDLFSHRPIERKVMTFFSYVIDFYPARLPTSFVQCSSKIQKAAKKFISFGCHPPLNGVTRGGPPHPPPPSDATVI